MPKYDGVTVTIGEDKYIVPPLSLKSIKRHQADFESMDKKSPLEMLEITSQVLHEALSRNYADITQDQVDDMVDINNMGQWMQAIAGASGLKAGGAPAGSGQTGT